MAAFVRTANRLNVKAFAEQDSLSPPGLFREDDAFPFLYTVVDTLLL